MRILGPNLMLALYFKMSNTIPILIKRKRSLLFKKELALSASSSSVTEFSYWVANLKLILQTAGQDMEKAITRYSRCRRKDPEVERREANEDVYVTRKKFHQVRLQV